MEIFYQKTREFDKDIWLVATRRFQKIGDARNVRFIFDESNKAILRKLMQYFLRIESENQSLKKGICLSGNVGTGKSEIMRIFQQLLKGSPLSFKFATADAVGDYYAKTGNIDKYMIGNWCFDELGFENDKSHFGNRMNVMSKVIMNRYSGGLGLYTHFTTNLNFSQIMQKYDNDGNCRISSRLQEMCNFIEFARESEDRRSEPKSYTYTPKVYLYDKQEEKQESNYYSQEANESRLRAMKNIARARKKFRLEKKAGSTPFKAQKIEITKENIEDILEKNCKVSEKKDRERLAKLYFTDKKQFQTEIVTY